MSLLVGPAAVLGASLLQSDVAWDAASQATETLSLALFFVAVPTLTRGQTLGQKLLRLRIVRPDARQAGWYQSAGRYGLLFLFAWAPFAALFGLTGLDPSTAVSYTHLDVYKRQILKSVPPDGSFSPEND